MQCPKRSYPLCWRHGAPSCHGRWWQPEVQYGPGGHVTVVVCCVLDNREVYVLTCTLTPQFHCVVSQCIRGHEIRTVDPCSKALLRMLQLEAIGQCVRLSEDELSQPLQVFLERLVREVTADE